MVIHTRSYAEFFWPGEVTPNQLPRTLATISFDGTRGELVNNNDYATYLVMKNFRKLPGMIKKYQRGRNLCFMDLTRADKETFGELVKQFKLTHPIPAKFHDINVQQDWYEETGVFENKDSERVKRIIKQVRDNKEYMRQYRLDKKAGLR